MSPPPLSHFPDLCLLAIFKHIPLSDLIRHIGFVCSNWSRVQRDELKRRDSLVILQRKNQIKEIQGNPNESDHGFNALLLPKYCCECGYVCCGSHKLKEEFTSPLMVLLPNITHLTIFQSPVFSYSLVVSLEQIVILINQYAAKLISLQVEFRANLIPRSIVTVNKAGASMAALFDSINRLESLRHLTLNGTFSSLNAQPSLRVLSRLNTFTVRDFNNSSLLLALLREHASTGAVRVNCLKCLQLIDLIRLEPQLANRFTRVCTEISKLSDFDNIRLFCTRFNSLSSLNLSMDSMPMTMLARALSLLPQLISLDLNYGSIPEEEQTLPQLPIAQVSSLTRLTLTISTKSHHDTERLHLHQIFPNLKQFHLSQSTYECDECGYQFKYAIDMRSSKLDARISHCMRLARQPFHQCANLNSIKFV